MTRALRLLLTICLFVFFGMVFLSSARIDPGFITVVALASCALGLSVALLSDSTAFFCLGAAICVLPVFGPGVLNLFVLGWLAGVYFLRALFGFASVSIDLSGSREIASWAFFLLMLPLLCAVGLTFYLEFDPTILWALYRNQGLDGIFAFMTTSQVPWHRATILACGYMLSGALFYAVLSVQNVTQNTLWFARGTLAGAFISLAFLVGQLQPNPGWFFLNMNPFWHYVGRYPATFSDPNSFGIVAMLLIPFFLGLSSTKDRGWLYLSGAMSLLIFSVWAGSRTLYFGLALWLFVVGIAMLRMVKKRELQAALLVSFALFSCSVLLVGYPPINEAVQQALPYPGSQRILRTVNWSEASEMLSSRRVYSKIAYLTWAQSPLTGLGLERFYGEQTRVMKSFGIDLGAWRDNANNFYLQVLVEQGAFGLALLCIAIGYFAFIFLSPERRVIVDVDKVEPAAEQRVFSLTRGILLVFLLALVTGPHLHFDEVRYIIFFFLAIAVSRPIIVKSATRTFIRSSAVALVLLFPAFFYVSVSKGTDRPLSRGFYPIEDGTGTPVAWSADRARMFFCEIVGDHARLRIRATQPDIATQPLRVALFEREPSESGPLNLSELQPVRLKLTDSSWHEVLIPMPKRGLRALSSVELRVERLWNPKRAKVGNDPRWLGVMIQWPKESC